MSRLSRPTSQKSHNSISYGPTNWMCRLSLYCACHHLAVVRIFPPPFSSIRFNILYIAVSSYKIKIDRTYDGFVFLQAVFPRSINAKIGNSNWFNAILHMACARHTLRALRSTRSLDCLYFSWANVDTGMHNVNAYGCRSHSTVALNGMTSML